VLARDLKDGKVKHDVREPDPGNRAGDLGRDIGGRTRAADLAPE